MKKLFQNLMKDRYGFDQYCIILFLFSLIFLQLRYLWVIGILVSGYAIYRIFSKNKEKRYKELAGFNRYMMGYMRFVYSLFSKMKQFFVLNKRKFQERKSALLIRCPQCKKVLRLPKNKGMLEVSCPACRNSFNKKT